MNRDAILVMAVDALVPFGRILRADVAPEPFARWPEVVFRCLPQTFLAYWLFSLVPAVGGLIYMLCLVPLSASLGPVTGRPRDRRGYAERLLVFLTVILIGFGGLWSCIGHTLLADEVAARIGWQAGSPFQTELAFFALGSGIAGLLAVWLRGHFITALVISKSVFWYGAALVHVLDTVARQNYAPLNIGAPLIGDLIFPTLLLFLLYEANRDGGG